MRLTYCEVRGAFEIRLSYEVRLTYGEVRGAFEFLDSRFLRGLKNSFGALKSEDLLSRILVFRIPE